jgi:hypothetical protein
VLAAHRAGIRTVFLPERNAKDILEVPQDVRNELSFVVVNNVRTVLDSVLETTPSAPPLAPLDHRRVVASLRLDLTVVGHGIAEAMQLPFPQLCSQSSLQLLTSGCPGSTARPSALPPPTPATSTRRQQLVTQ